MNEDVLYQEALSNYQIERDLIYFKHMNPTLSKDGDSWCCLYGSDLQAGIAGFGKTPAQAIENFVVQMNRN